MDWEAHLKYLQVVLKKFNIATTPLNELLIQYFWDGFSLLIQIQLDKQDRDIINWQETIEKVVNVKVKIICQALCRFQESEACCPHSH